MPELPEVETVKEALKGQIKGLYIEVATLYHEPMFKSGDREYFKGALAGQQIEDISRRGKYLIFQLTDYYLLSHLRMEGKFFYGSGTAVRKKHVHASFLLSNGENLYYEDVRKFGTFHLYDKKVNLEKTANFSVLGPEPFDKRFTIEHVVTHLKHKRMPIKSLLLTQKVVTGLGNIYVDEVLFASKIHPLKKSSDLTRDEVRYVVKYTKAILSQAIAYKGTTIKTFTSEHGASGGFQAFLQVHTKKDEPCPICATVIEKIKVGGRGTYFCRTCQPEVTR